MTPDEQMAREVAELVRETAHYEWEKAQRATLERTAAILAEVEAWFLKVPRHTARKAGTAQRQAGIAMGKAARSQRSAWTALEHAAWGAVDMAVQVELARGFAWIATLHAGEAWAWMQAAQPRSRIASRGARLMDLAISHPSLSVAKLNEMLAVPLDDSTARRYVRRVRPGR